MSDQRVGVVGDDSIAASVETAGGRPIVGTAGSVAEIDTAFVVAVGEGALVDLARAGLEEPVLSVDSGSGVGIRSVSREAAAAAIERTLEGEYTTDAHASMTATPPDGGVRLLFDAALVTKEPARISEYDVRYNGEQIARFRADGVVVSTPAGSVGYGRSAGGPIVAPKTDVVAVVPIASFATHTDQWVLSPEAVSVGVQRDETPVELVADGRPATDVDAGTYVELSRGDDFETVVVPECDPPF